MHQLGILPAALHYYKQALDVGPIIKPETDVEVGQEGTNTKNNSNIYDLSR